MLSFELEGLLNVLEEYNQSIWPLQVFSYALGVLASLLSFKRIRYGTSIVILILAFYWLWNGMVFCPVYWAPSYPSAYIFGALCTIQGLLFLLGAIRSKLPISYRKSPYSITGIILVLYAMVGYAVFGYFLGHTYPRSFPFGLVPCPTVIFTIGILLLTNKKVPAYFLIIPLIMALGGVLAVLRGVLEDLGLIIAGLLGTVMISLRNKSIEDESE